ncbi:MAG: helix-turn-helix domain-containing protein [Gemmatimonadales bacterium]|nr:helix-turn-helix domain-containing protein [Candidatus Palauibacter ramosifaciens]
MSKFKTSAQESRAELHASGCHFVLCNPDKSPCWARWQKAQPQWWEIEAHLADGGLLALIPYSLGFTGLDIDSGNPARFIAEQEPAAVLESRREGGRHLYFHDLVARRNAKFELADYGISGDVRGASGYLVVWDGQGWAKLASAYLLERRHQFPGSLFEAADVPAPAAVVNVPRPLAATRAGLQALEGVSAGGRNDALFDHVRMWAYGQPRGESRDAWAVHVRNFAGLQNLRFDEPLPGYEVAATARSIATWCWDRPNWADPQAQRRRQGLQVKARRQSTRPSRLQAHQLRAEGRTVRDIAAELGRPRSTVGRWLKQPIPAAEIPGLSRLPSGN